MLRRMRYCVIPLILLACALPALAQQQPKPEENFYRLDFVLRQLEDGKTVNTRSYSMWIGSGSERGSSPGGNIRAGSSVPIVGSQSDKTTSINYTRVGVSIDCRLIESTKGVVLTLNGSISAAVAPPSQDAKNPLTPLLQQIDINAYTLLTLGKATIISSVDDPSSNRRFVLEVTATKLN